MTVHAKEPASVKLADVLMLDGIAYICEAKESSLTGIKDPWLGGLALGVQFDSDKKRKVSHDSLHQLQTAVSNAVHVASTQKAPWIPGPPSGVLVFNTQGKPFLYFEWREHSNAGVTRVSQVISVNDGVARFAFGDERLLYMEFEDPDVRRALRHILKTSLEPSKKPSAREK